MLAGRCAGGQVRQSRSQGLGLGQRLDAQLALEQGAQDLILAQRLCPLAQPGMGLHEGAVEGLVQVILGQPATRDGQDVPPCASRLVQSDGGCDGAQEALRQALAFHHQPQLVFRRLVDRQAIKEGAAVQGQCSL